MQVRVLVALLVASASLTVRGVSWLSATLMNVAALLVLPELYAVFLSRLSGGWPLDEVFCLQTHCVKVDDHEDVVYAGLEVVDCRHGCYDLSEKEFFHLSTTFFHSGLAAPSVDFLIVVWQRRLYVVVKSSGKDESELLTALCKALQGLKEALSVVGCSWRLLEGSQIREILRPGVLRPSRGSKFSKLLVLLSLLTPLITRNPGFLAVSLAASLALLRGLNQAGLSAVQPLRVFTVEVVSSFFTFPSTREILSRARTLYSLLPRDSYLAFRIEPATYEEEQTIDTEAYRSYEIGTALDKLSIIHRSSKYFAAARRRWDRREALYRVAGVVVAEDRVGKLLSRLGLKLSSTPVGLEVIG